MESGPGRGTFPLFVIGRVDSACGRARTAAAALAEHRAESIDARRRRGRRRTRS